MLNPVLQLYQYNTLAIDWNYDISQQSKVTKPILWYK